MSGLAAWSGTAGMVIGWFGVILAALLGGVWAAGMAIGLTLYLSDRAKGYL